MNCPRCGRNNSEDALFCSRCGQRMGGRSSGVTYRQRQQAGGFGIGQGLLAFIVVLLAGVVVAGGAFAVVILGRPVPPPSQIAVISPSPSITPSPLETFVQPTASPSPTASPLPTLSLLPTPSASILPSPSASPSVQPTPPPTRPPTAPPTRQPTPRPTPVDCGVASQGPTRELFLGVGNDTQRSPRAGTWWCVHRATFRMVFGSTFGEVRLLRNNRVLASANCTWPGGCPEPIVVTFDEPRTVRPDGALRYQFACTGDPLTLEDDCADGTPDGGTIEVDFEPIEGP